MLSARRVQHVDALDTRWVHIAIDQQLPKNVHRLANKDAHLVALAHDPGDKRILSNDTKARAHFQSLPEERVRALH